MAPEQRDNDEVLTEEDRRNYTPDSQESAMLHQVAEMRRLAIAQVAGQSDVHVP